MDTARSSSYYDTRASDARTSDVRSFRDPTDEVNFDLEVIRQSVIGGEKSRYFQKVYQPTGINSFVGVCKATGTSINGSFIMYLADQRDGRGELYELSVSDWETAIDKFQNVLDKDAKILYHPQVIKNEISKKRFMMYKYLFYYTFIALLIALAALQRGFKFVK